MSQTRIARWLSKHVKPAVIGATATLGIVTLLYGVNAADKTTGSAKIKELQNQRVTVLQEVRNATAEAYKTKHAPLTDVLAATLAVLDARLDLAESQEERLKLLEEAVKHSREIEETAKTMFQSGQANRVDVLKSTAGRLEREIALERARQNFKKD